MLAANADDYAEANLSRFFTASDNNTLEDGNLTGQCVSLVKWFLQDMTGVPNPATARGPANVYGKTLVSQGYADEKTYAERQRGDIICYEYGQYGHIGIVLSGDRTFEENVAWQGVPSKLVDGLRVYASRIGSLSEPWRHSQHIYRVKSYVEEGEDVKPTDQQVDEWISYFHQEAYGSPASDEVFAQWRPVLKNNFLEGSLGILQGTDTNPGALKNQPKPGTKYTPYSGAPLYTEDK